MLEWALVYPLIGALAGIMAGLMGIGGGLVMVPALLFLFGHQNPQSPFVAHVAIGTSLAAIVPISASSAWAHYKRQAIDWPAFWRLAPGLLAGAALGAWLAKNLAHLFLQRLFAVFLLFVAWQMFHNPLQNIRAHERAQKYERPISMSIGTLSALVGIGGGTLTVPFLTWKGLPLPQAIATSSACGLPIALAGALGFFLAGQAQAQAFIHWPAAIGMAVVAMFSAPLGAHWAHTLPIPLLRRLFALVVLLVSLRLWSSH